MDIWNWLNKDIVQLYEAEPDLARRLREFPSRVTADHFAYVDAAYPEMLAAVRGMGHVWLEVYLRHWWLQSKVSRRHDLTEGLPEAVDLLDRVHQPDAEGCPQSICAVQDFCIAMGLADGPGYVEERLQACREALDRIDPTWSCWRCISSEYADALIDGDRAEEALAFRDEQRRAAEPAGRGEPADWTCVKGLLALGDYELALEEARRRDIEASGEHERVSRQTDIAECLAHLGRFDEALEELPDWGEIYGTASLFAGYSKTAVLAFRAGAAEWNGDVIERIGHMVSVLKQRGCWNGLQEIAADWGELAMRDEVPHWALADALLRRGREAQSQLRDPGRVEARFAALEEKVTAARPEPWEGTEDEILEQFGRAIQAEEKQVFSRAVSTIRARPDAADLVHFIATRWRQLDFSEEARLAYAEARVRAPGHPGLVGGHAATLVDEKDWQGLEALLVELDEIVKLDAKPELKLQALWFRSVLAEERGDVATASALLREMLAFDPENCTDRVAGRLAALLERQDDHAAALDFWQAAIERDDADAAEAFAEDDTDAAEEDEEEDDDGPGPSHWHWDRILCATHLGRWDVVRDSAIHLGMDVEPGDAPIDEEWGPIFLVDRRSEGPLWAMRTGPVTARVLAITGPFEPERHGELVIFVPKPLNPEEEEEEDRPYLFPIRETLEAGGHICCPWDGPRPDEERLEAFYGELREVHGSAYVSSGESYVQVDPATSEEIPAVFLKVAVPEGNGESADNSNNEYGAHRLVPLFERLARDAVAGQGGRGIALWPELLTHLGDEAGAEKHRELQREWSME